MLINILFTIVLAILLCLLWIMLYDSTHFEISTYKITDPRIQRQCRAVVIADLHNRKYGRDNELLLCAIHEGKPDFVFLAGDILTAKPGAKLENALEFVEALAKEYPIFYGVGNHEHRMELYPAVYEDMALRYEEGLAKQGVKLLKNEKRLLEEYGISVTGLLLHERFYKRFHLTKMEEEYLQDTLGSPDEKSFQVLLAHNPDYFPEYAKWGADLVLSGHVHGGVVRIPFWNRGVVSPAVRFFPKYDGGLFHEGGSAMILSRGLGIHTIPFRLFNPGELIFVDFTNGEQKKIWQFR